MVLPKIKNFSLLLFIFLSPTFVEFRQWYCRNSLSFLRLLNKLKQYLYHQLTSNLVIFSQKTPKTVYENSEIVKMLHGLVCENHIFFLSFSQVTFKQVSFFFIFFFFSMSQGLTKKTAYARMFQESEGAGAPLQLRPVSITSQCRNSWDQDKVRNCKKCDIYERE